MFNTVILKSNFDTLSQQILLDLVNSCCCWLCQHIDAMVNMIGLDEMSNQWCLIEPCSAHQEPKMFITAVFTISFCHVDVTANFVEPGK